VSAYVDRTQVSEVETIKLVLTSKKNARQPSLSSLEKDFDVLSTSSSSRVNIVNGKMNSTYEWIVVLAPRRTGKLLIPAIGVGNELTDPIEITVKQDSSGSGESKDIFLEVHIEPENPYVQSQLVYSVKLYHAIELQEGGLSSPEIDKAIVERLGDDITNIENIKGRRYRVTERRFAIFPQQSGVLTIPAIVFDGQVVDSNKGRSNFDPFFNRRFQSTRPVRVRSKEITLNILPKPKSAKGQWWLPAENLFLVENWSPNPPQFRVGEPTTRTITLVAEGLTESQLPDIPATDTEAFKLYPDQAEKETTTKQNTIVSRKVQKVALVPTRVGKAVLPEMVIHWWDTKRNKAMVSKIAAQTINVLPALSATQAADVTGVKDNSGVNPLPDTSKFQKLKNDENILNENKSANILSDKTFNGRIWIWFALLFFILWVVTLILWYRHSRRITFGRVANSNNHHGIGNSLSNQNKTRSISVAKKQIKSASLANEPGATREHVINWAVLVWPDKKISNIGCVVKLLKQDAVKNCLIDLDRTLYSDNTAAWDGAAFWHGFSDVDITENDTGKKKKQALEALYSSS